MGQIIRLPTAPAAYPEAAADLNPAECVLLIAIRWWVADFDRREDPLPRLCQAMGAAGAHDAAFSVDQLMAVFVRTARRPMAIHGPGCPSLSGDEKHLLRAASLVQSGDSKRAECALRAALLSAQGVEFALGPLKGLGRLFAEARLIFRRRRSPGGDAPAAEDAARIPSAPPKTIH
jgi:hypothetical protein